MPFPPPFEPAESGAWFAWKLSVRFVGKGGKPLKARVMAVMQRRIDGRIAVELSLEDILPAWPLLVLDTVHLDVTSWTFRDCRLRVDFVRKFERLGGLGIGKRKELSAAIQIVATFASVVSTEATGLGVALRQNVHGPATDEFLAGEFERARRVSFRLVFAPSPESDAVVFVADDAAVGDGSARHVAC